VVKQIRSRCIGKLGICGLESGYEVQLRSTLGGRTHESSVRY
jgi:hypothetical protein